MAQRRVVELTDDLDGGKADETIGFRLDGTGYQIDLSKVNADKFRKTVSEYVGAAASRRRPGTPAASRCRRIHWQDGRHPRLGSRQRSQGQQPRPHPGKATASDMR